VLSELFDFQVVTAADVFNFGAPVCTLRTLPAAAAARPCIAANEEVARKLRVDWTHCSMPMEPKEAAGALFGLGAALGAAATLFFFCASSRQPATFGAMALGWRPEATAAAAPFEFEAAFCVLRGFSRELASSLLEGSLTSASISFCSFSFWAEVIFLDACATIKKWAWDINQ
jgi:hypothetical protein